MTVPVAPPPTSDVVDEARSIVDSLSTEQRLHLLSGDAPAGRGLVEMARRYNARPYVAGSIPEAGLDGIRFADGPRGIVMGASTAFPVSMARGATFDPDLEAVVGDVIGVEGRSQGANLFAGVCINLLRHPAWGRAQETYGEDPQLLADMGVALTVGVQRHMMACVKHFAVNQMENSRFIVDVRIDEADLREIYLPHFRAVVDAGAAAVMSSYNKCNGEWCGHHHQLLGDILRDEWGFEGFVMSDFVLGIRDGAAALTAGMDLEMPFRWRFRHLDRDLARGRVSDREVAVAGTRLVSQQLRFATVGEPERYSEAAVACDDHRSLARQVAERSMVLLRNEPAAPGEEALLPITDTTGSIAVIGRLATRPNLGDLGSSRVYPPEVATLFDGLAEHFPSITATDGASSDTARRLAADAATAVVVVGLTAASEGEFTGRDGGDRSSLRLRRSDEALIATVCEANPRTVVVLMGGSALVTEAWRHLPAAILMAWYPGMEGGHALANIITGVVEPGGRLPCTWPRSGRQLPPFDRFTRTADYGPLHGYRKFIADGATPAYWFGHGLGYTTFEIGSASVAVNGVAPEIAVNVRNTGTRAGRVLLQAYVDEPLGTERRPLPTLRGYQWAQLDAGESTTVQISVDPDAVSRAGERAGWPVTIRVGPSADPTLCSAYEVMEPTA